MFSKDNVPRVLIIMILMQVLTFADMEGGETFDASLLGIAEEVTEERVSDDDVVLIKGAKSSRAVSEYIPSYCVQLLRLLIDSFLVLFLFFSI